MHKAIKQRCTPSYSSQGEDREAESSEGEGMKLRPPSSTGCKQICRIYDLGLEDSQLDTQCWTEGMQQLNEHNTTYLKPRRPSPSEDIHFSQQPPGWFGSDELEPDNDNMLSDADAENRSIKDESEANNLELLAEIRALKHQNEKLQAQVNDTSQELEDVLAKNSELNSSLDHSHLWYSTLVVKTAALRSQNNDLQEDAVKQQVKLEALTGIITQTGDIFVEFGSSSFDGEKLHRQMNDSKIGKLSFKNTGQLATGPLVDQ
ncbi:hypothetical protein EV360DRAFT_72439 [Lentinula raphanica]|nr:hypothetical protein EV360DRAFT_72439 [Lentinula raphanica]